MSNFVLVQRNPDRAVELEDEHHQYEWIFYRHADGKFVSMRKLSSWEITQAKEQRDLGIVLDGGHTLEGLISPNKPHIK